TNQDGYFAFKDVPDDALLEISYVGFLQQTIPAAADAGRIVLKSVLSELDEVVITGYSAERKKDITGSVSVVDVEAMKRVPTGSSAQALQGMASGVNVVSSGAPGGNSNIFVRGVSSFGNTQPLVLVDGVQADLKDVNVNDIESIQVLKDAGAAAIYGVRGANGVIIVTTKRGRTGEPTVSYNAFAGVQLPIPGNPYDIVINPEAFRNLALIADPNNALFKDGVPDFLYSGPSGSGIAWAGDPQVDSALYRLDKANPGNSYLIQAVNKQGTNWF